MSIPTLGYTLGGPLPTGSTIATNGTRSAVNPPTGTGDTKTEDSGDVTIVLVLCLAVLLPFVLLTGYIVARRCLESRQRKAGLPTSSNSHTLHHTQSNVPILLNGAPLSDNPYASDADSTRSSSSPPPYAKSQPQPPECTSPSASASASAIASPSENATPVR